MAKRQIAKYNGAPDVDVRIISKKDQNRLVGAAVAKTELRWDASNNHKVDITDLHEDVITYIKDEDGSFTVTEVEIEDETPEPAAGSTKSARS